MVKKEYTTALIILITIALLGLIAIQLYWINSAITLEKRQFRESANEALANVAKKRDMLEVSAGVLQNDLVQDLVTEIETKHQGDHLTVRMDSNYVQEQVEIRDSVITEEGEERRFRIVEGSSADSMSGLYTYARIIKESFSEDMTLPEGLDVNMLRGDSTLRIDLSNMREDMITLRVKLVNEILAKLFTEQYSLPIEERINLKALDSLISAELKDAGIDAGYKFSIRRADGSPLDVNGEASPHYEAKTSTEKYVQNLFPDNPIMNAQAGFLHLEFPNEDKYVLSRLWLMLVISGVFLLGVIYAFYSTVTTILRQKKLSVIKNDFINNMTHELKTPISTISLACEALNDPDINAGEKTRSTYLKMINDENKRLGTLVERVLQTAILDKGELRLKKEEVNIHPLIDDVVRSVDIQVRTKGGEINTALAATDPMMEGDKMHLSNVVYNLVDNAIKYSGGKPEITISTDSTAEYVKIEVEDNGIGISSEEQKKIFDKLYRVPTGDVHNVKGFGLGLSYVSAIVNMHGGTISVKSELGKGSTFTIKLPHHE